MHVSALLDPSHLIDDHIKIHRPVNGRQHLPVGGLDADLQLHETRPEAVQKPDLLIIQKIRRDLEMEVRDTVVVLLYETEKLLGPGMVHIEGPVHKFHLGNLLLQEKGQLFFHQRQAPEAHPFVNRGKTVAAGKRAASAAFIIYDPVLKFCHVSVDKRQFIELFILPHAGAAELSRLIPVDQSLNLSKAALPVIPAQKFPEGGLPFSGHDSPHAGFPGKDLLAVVRNLRTSQPDIDLRQDLF